MAARGAGATAGHTSGRFLSSGAPESIAHLMPVFRQSLAETGYIEGRNVAIEYRWAEGKYDRMPTMAEELLRGQVAVILASPAPSGTSS